MIINYWNSNGWIKLVLEKFKGGAGTQTKVVRCVYVLGGGGG